MPKEWLIPPLLLSASLACAEPLWRCPGPDGQPLFTNQPCEGAEAVSLPPLGEISGMSALPERRPAPPAQPARQGRATGDGPLSYGERTRWRRLSMERDGLERDLRRGPLHGRQREALQSRLREVRQELAPLERRARQHLPSP